MVDIEGLQNKAFKFTIEWVVNSEYVFAEGLEEYLDKLRETGSAEIINAELVDKTP